MTSAAKSMPPQQPAERQEMFGGYDHDSLQYHVFCGDMVAAGRLFRTNSLEHASLWIFDGETLRELSAGRGPLVANGASHLDTTAGGLAFRDTGDAVEISLADAAGAAVAEIRLSPRRDVRWNDTISTVVHQPDMTAELTVEGRRHEGVGYCKRYAWTPAPKHWGYRFVQGFVDDGALSIWTAEATFGTDKYDYFRMLSPDGVVSAALADESCHRQDTVFARTDKGPVRLALEQCADWRVRLESPRMDSLLRQRVCRLTVAIEDRTYHGMAINETCYGTLG